MAGISIVIPHYGAPGPTAALVGALLSQAGAAMVEVIVSDDASPQAFPDTPGAVVVRNERNGGFGSAVNTGAKWARHDLLLILNSDLQVGPTFVADLLKAAEPWMPAVASPRVVSPGGEVEWTGRHFPTVSHQLVEWLTPLARWRDSPRLHEAVGHVTAARTSDTVVDWVVGAAMLLATADFRAVGGFDERYFMNSEEVDLQRRLRERGVRSVALVHPVVIHEGGGSSDPEKSRSWLVTSRLRYADKWGFRRRLVVALTLATGVNLVWNTGRRLLGRPVSPWITARSEMRLVRPPHSDTLS